ncbi:hypothetical protein KFK09_023460 [Dendrobium nobile]|uniref:Endoglucanase n=1 Tax=Dendrobium nobile TaxID=94219 RepID=A0A8T3AMW1_DENNO|nr:hypothetical protein KFK09_023460 [Dendrobium nobile]
MEFSFFIFKPLLQYYLRLLLLLLLCVNYNSQLGAIASFNYGEALSKSLLYFEAQRSGRLPHLQRVKWRESSALTDGLQQGVDLVGGYYDAGDHVKFGLPMAFTITMLSWSAIEHADEIASAGERRHALEAIKWGTDYFLKAHTHPDVLWVQVGEGSTDHYCWQRPEDMTTSRRAYKIDSDHPGSEVAAETAAAMAAASMVFRTWSPSYSALLLRHARELFEFADRRRGRYDSSVPAAKGYYPSLSGYGDELLWAALWLRRATGDSQYLDYVVNNAYELGGATWAVSEFSWDIKYAGLQLMAAKLLMDEGPKLSTHQRRILEEYKSKGEHYVCACLNLHRPSNNSRANKNVRRTPAGLLYVRQWNNLQYVSTAAFLLATYSDHLASAGLFLRCPTDAAVPSAALLSFARTQADYILGDNPLRLSYLVGFGHRYPSRVHHRAASSGGGGGDFVGCTEGYHRWFGRNRSNPHVVVGAVVGGPDSADGFRDVRSNFMQTEACTYNTAPMVGVFARLNREINSAIASI